MRKPPTIVKILVALSFLVGLPLLGISLVGLPLSPYLQFPPVTVPVPAAPFSWPVFVGLSALIVCAVGPIAWRAATVPGPQRLRSQTRRPFPWWGWAGGTLTVLSWVVAWNRFPWLADVQPHTFTPLWIGYVMSINGWTFHRTGRCLMLDRPRWFLSLFPVSAAFWWCFEYLNRFVHNWYYVGEQELTAFQYIVYATIPFSTVLPAVMSTMELLASLPLTGGMNGMPPLRWTQRRGTGWLLLALASLGLTGIGIWPEWLFPLVWVAPLLLITALQIVGGEETIFSAAEEGDWTLLWLAAVAALFCGLWWEMWNSKSLAHWEYAIPSVHRFKLFEMPLLGYAGYLPFGLECLAVVMFVFPHRRVFMPQPADGQWGSDSRERGCSVRE